MPKYKIEGGDQRLEPTEEVTYTKEELVKAIKRHHKSSIVNALEVGRYLTILQGMVAYGEYERIVEQELPFSIPTAQLYKRIYDRLERFSDHREAILTMTLNEADRHLALLTKQSMDAWNSRKRKTLSGWSRKRFVPPIDEPEGVPEERPWDLRSLTVELSNKLAEFHEKKGDWARKLIWVRIVDYINGNGKLEGIPGDGEEE